MSFVQPEPTICKRARPRQPGARNTPVTCGDLVDLDLSRFGIC